MTAPYDAARDSADSYNQGIAFKRLEAMGVKRKVIGAAELWMGDAAQIVPALGKIDAVVTDPPYGIGSVWKGGFSAKHGWAKAGADADARNEWDIGVEREPRWFDLACRRIEEAQRQGDLFVKPSGAA